MRDPTLTEHAGTQMRKALEDSANLEKTAESPSSCPSPQGGEGTAGDRQPRSGLVLNLEPRGVTPEQSANGATSMPAGR
jgi:hypothetical protein